jgi:hypothetical protein
MKLMMAALAACLALPLPVAAQAQTGVGQQSQMPAPTTDAELRQEIIRRSLASYSGNCPCPYNRDRAGRSCGARSAYSRPGGASPKCYPSDVSDAEVQRFRESRR